MRFFDSKSNFADQSKNNLTWTTVGIDWCCINHKWRTKANSCKTMERIIDPEVDLSGLNMSARSEMLISGPSPARNASPSSSSASEATCVALGKEEKDAKSTLLWALRNSRGGKFFILHVHQPAQKISIMGANVSISQLEEYRVREHHEAERRNMHKLLDSYILICKRIGVRAEKLYIEMNSIEKGIVELISQYSIKKLVLGAAADKQYSKKMMEPKSGKAIYVLKEAPDFCHIWFVCKGLLIRTREGIPNGVNTVVMSPVLRASPSAKTGLSMAFRSRSVPEGKNTQLESIGSHPECRRIMSIDHATSFPAFPPLDHSGDITPQRRSSFKGSTDIWDGMSMKSPSVGSHTSPSPDAVDNLPSVLVTTVEQSGDEVVSYLQTETNEENRSTCSTPRVIAGTLHDEIYNKLQQYAEAENYRREAYEESMKRRKAEKKASEARGRAKALEAMHSEELRRRKDMEEEVEKIKSQLDESKENLRVSLEHNSSLEHQVKNSDEMVHELEQKIISAIDLLQKYKNERDDALRDVEDLKSSHREMASSVPISCFFTKYSLSELEVATLNFDPALKIGEGGYGSIYRGRLQHTQVAIKMLHPDSKQGPLEFQQEVNVLGKLRHPNLVILMGACPEASALVYEYLPNGSLEDCLKCKDNTPSLSWQTRIRIARELCSVIVFLHSCRPQCIVHCDLKPGNILLDANFVSKLSDFGICRALSKGEVSNNNTTFCHITAPKGTVAYMDPEFLETGELTTKSDVYSFGVILLRLLTGKPAVGITREVQSALDRGGLRDMLDSTAGDWPFNQAKQLAQLAMSCCERTRKNRPELASQVWRILERMQP